MITNNLSCDKKPDHVACCQSNTWRRWLDWAEQGGHYLRLFVKPRRHILFTFKMFPCLFAMNHHFAQVHSPTAPCQHLYIVCITGTVFWSKSWGNMLDSLYCSCSGRKSRGSAQPVRNVDVLHQMSRERHVGRADEPRLF
jgi:hypothetical protein